MCRYRCASDIGTCMHELQRARIVWTSDQNRLHCKQYVQCAYSHLNITLKKKNPASLAHSCFPLFCLPSVFSGLRGCTLLVLPSSVATGRTPRCWRNFGSQNAFKTWAMQCPYVCPSCCCVVNLVDLQEIRDHCDMSVCVPFFMDFFGNSKCEPCSKRRWFHRTSRCHVQVEDVYNLRGIKDNDIMKANASGWYNSYKFDSLELKWSYFILYMICIHVFCLNVDIDVY